MSSHVVKIVGVKSALVGSLYDCRVAIDCLSWSHSPVLSPALSSICSGEAFSPLAPFAPRTSPRTSCIRFSRTTMSGCVKYGLILGSIAASNSEERLSLEVSWIREAKATFRSPKWDHDRLNRVQQTRADPLRLRRHSAVPALPVQTAILALNFHRNQPQRLANLGQLMRYQSTNL